jgi:anaerobic ribonucleoside-triphosphate reductase activating protein
MSPGTWSPTGGTEAEVESIAMSLLSHVGAGVEGITISGGEPFEQAESLTHLLRLLRAGLPENVDVLIFTGMGIATVTREFPEVLALADAVVAGPYLEGQPSRLVWRSSSNQVLQPLSPLGWERYRPYLDNETDEVAVEVVVSPEGLTLIGIPPAGEATSWIRDATQMGLQPRDAS